MLNKRFKISQVSCVFWIEYLCLRINSFSNYDTKIYTKDIINMNIILGVLYPKCVKYDKLGMWYPIYLICKKMIQSCALKNNYEKLSCEQWMINVYFKRTFTLNSKRRLTFLERKRCLDIFFHCPLGVL